MIHPKIRSLAIGLGVALAASAAAAATISVPGNFDTIQEAVDAAVSGDTIEVSAGVYDEGVDIPAGLTFLTITGDCSDPSAVVIDPAESDDGFYVDSTATNFRLECVTIRHGYYSVESYADDTTLYQVHAIGGDGFYISADGAQVLYCSSYGSYNYGVELYGDDAYVLGFDARIVYYGGVYVSGDDAVIFGCDVDNFSYDAGIYLYGDNGLVDSNKVKDGYDYQGIYTYGDFNTIVDNKAKNISDDDCYYIYGDANTVDGNLANGCGTDYGFNVYGDNNTVKDNEAKNVYYGYYVYCSGDCFATKVKDNMARGVGYDGYELYLYGAGGAVVKRNYVERASWEGIYVYGNNNPVYVEDNVAWDCGSDDYQNFDIYYIDGGRVSGNMSYGAWNGFYLYGSDDLEVENNMAVGAVDNGFEIAGGASQQLYSNNTAMDNNGEGFVNNATDTKFVDNTASGNRTDCANDGSIFLSSGNHCADGSDFLVGNDID